MGWRPEEGFYEKHTKGEKEGVSYKIVSLQQAINKLGIGQIREGISLLAKKRAKENGNLAYEPINLSNERIEYVIEENGEELDR